jgi:hypothetical protein
MDINVSWAANMDLPMDQEPAPASERKDSESKRNDPIDPSITQEYTRTTRGGPRVTPGRPAAGGGDVKAPAAGDVKVPAARPMTDKEKENFDLFTRFMADCVGKRGKRDANVWIGVPNTISFTTDAEFLKTWDKGGVSPTYQTALNEALAYVNLIVKTRKITLLEQLRKHRPYFLQLAHIRWCQNERSSKDGVWKQQNTYLQEAVDLKAICGYYSSLK